jgi:hypothetical protein
MIIAAINLLILSVLIFIIGMIKPGWLLFWMEKPSRMPILWIVVFLFMIATVLFGEGERQKQLANAAQSPATNTTKNEIPTPKVIPPAKKAAMPTQEQEK